MSTVLDHPVLRALAAAAAALLFTAPTLAQTPAQTPAQASAQTSTQTPANKVVLQVSDNDPGKWNLALNNAKNIQADLGAGNVTVEIVAYGPGIGMLKMDSAVAGRIDQALAAGVNVVACENTMRNAKLTKADMLDHVGYVPSGVVELMHRQQQGWSYLRP